MNRSDLFGLGCCRLNSLEPINTGICQYLRSLLLWLMASFGSVAKFTRVCGAKNTHIDTDSFFSNDND
jgi:hypothetical protein